MGPFMIKFALTTLYTLIAVWVGLGLFVAFYPPDPSKYETRCFNSQGKQLYHSVDSYHPHITRWGKVTCVTVGIK